MKKILIAEDESALRGLIVDHLSAKQFQVEYVDNGSDALRRLQSDRYDIVILDWNLPGMEGIDVCKQFRSSGGVTPILMLTGKREVDDKEAGLEAGADDYLTKPFHIKELSARLKALLRRCEMGVHAAGKGTIDSTVLDRYEMRGVAGKGFSGVVYKGRHRLLDRPVAIKMLQSARIADEELMARFQLEAKVVSSLSHPNVVTLYDFGTTSDGLPYLIMDYVEGASLEAVVEVEDHLELNRAIQLFGQLCDALAYMHSKGLLHRDVKPGNIMITRDDAGKEVLKLIDFGLVKLLAGDDRKGLSLTQEGEVLGTPLYMSPEQCIGGELDCRSDIYSAGCILYEMLTGTDPIKGETALQTMFMRTTEDAKPFAVARPDLNLPPALERIALKALARDRADRYQSIEELKRELEHVWLRRVNLQTSN